MSRSLSVAGLGIVVVGALTALVTGAELLNWELPGGVALGNPLTAIGTVALAGIGYLLATGRVTRVVGFLAVGLAVLWYPVSFGLADDVNLNFSGDTFATFVMWTAAVTGIALLSIAASIIERIVLRFGRR